MRSPIITVDVLDSGTIQGAGPLFEILGVEVVTELDRAGTVTVSVPALDSRAIDLVDTGLELYVNADGEGVMGRGLLEEWNISAGRVPTYNLTGLDLLGELNYLTTGYQTVYEDANTATAIIGTNATATSLLGDTGWTQGTVSIGGDYTTTTIEFNGDTRLSALIALCKQIGHHFRQGTTARTLDVGTFGSDSGFRVVNVHHALAGQADSTVSGYISQIDATTANSNIENKIYPTGKDRFDMRDTSSTITDIEVETQFGLSGFSTTADGSSSGATIPVTATTDGTRSFSVGDEVWVGDADDWTADHEYGVIQSISAGVSITLTAELENSYSSGADVIQRPQFYVTDATSVSTYGTRQADVQFPWIIPTNVAAHSDRQSLMGTALYYAAKEHLARYKDPFKAYTISEIYDLPTTLQVGDKIRVTYRGQAGPGGNVFLNVNDDFFVMSIARKWDGTGRGGARGISRLEVSNVARPVFSKAKVNINAVSRHLAATSRINLLRR